MKNKKAAVMLACALAVGCAIGGSLAWLTDQTGNVTNTFSVGDINIDLKEHDYVPESKTLDTEKKPVTENVDYVFVPGDTLPKDPFVTVGANSEDCYLFVKVSGINNTHKDLSGRIIDWTVSPHLEEQNEKADGWTKYELKTEYEDDAKTVVSTEYWYCKVLNSSADQIWYILQNDSITVNRLVTKDMVSDIKNKKPQVVLTAAAVQVANLADSEEEDANVAAAWEQVKDLLNAKKTESSESGSSGE